MTLKEVLVKPVKAKPKSWLDTIQEQLDPDDFTWLIECLKNTRDFSGAYIASKLTEAGFPVSSTTINLARKSL